jgi:hypothetical protein
METIFRGGMKKLLILLLIFSNLAFAEESVVVIKAGQPSPMDGYVINQERAEHYRNTSLDLGLCTKTKDLITQENSLINEQLTRSNGRIKEQNEYIQDTKDGAIWTKVGFFVLGAAAASLVAFGAARAVR